MKSSKIKFGILLLSVFSLFAAVGAQTSKFESPDVEYTFEIPDPKWKLTTKPSATTPNVEYVYVDRNDGHLEVRRLNILEKTSMTDVVRNEESKLQFMQGYVAGKEEPYAGFLNGTVFNFEFVRSGRPMSGRFYFLKASPTSVYVLRFTGFRDKLRVIRNQTDSVARTFSLKKK